MRDHLPSVVAALCLLAAAGSTPGQPPPADAAAARAFVAEAEARLRELALEGARAQWVMSNFITDDTLWLVARSGERSLTASAELAREAARFDTAGLDADTARRLALLQRSFVLVPPADPAATAELARLAASLEGAYGAARHCAPDGTCRNLDELSRVIETSRDPEELREAWLAWRTATAPSRADYARMVELANQGARELGHDDLGALWRSAYDMDEAAFAAEVDRLWQQMRPLYEALHCHVRARLNEHYGDAVVPPGGPIPAHLLGNMWAQSWENVADLVGPETSDPGYDLDELLLGAGVDERELVRYGERFFTSLGFAPLPETFWERSLFTRPADRDVVCHASAYDVDFADDLRIKMCIEVGAEDFTVVHHELGHNFYQRAYKEQPFLYQDSAHDGFHEALGDTIALSVTPEYLVRIGLLDEAPPAAADLGILMRRALENVAFLPFGVLMDRWRWGVFSGDVAPGELNAGWWELRRDLQGVAPPAPRSEADFDPGAKFHIPGNTPYARYFLATVLQYQLHRGLCRAIDDAGPLHRCSIYGSEEAGRRLARLMEMGASRPWPEALEAAIGEERMDATALVDYFAPLATWLEEQNRGRTCGWATR